MTIVRTLRRIAAVRPTAHAIASERLSLSFLDLADRAGAVAAALSDAGVRAGDRVGIVVGDPAEWAAAYLGVLQAGAVGVLLPFAAPRPEVLRCLDHAEASAVLLDERHPDAATLADEARGRGWRVLTPKEGGPGTAAAPSGSADRHVGAVEHPSEAGDLAVLIYTSGTTGTPKGVMLSHGNLDANARAIARALGLGESDRGLSSLPFNYSFGLSVLNSHIVAGASVLAQTNSVFPVRTLQRAQDDRATALYGTPTMLSQLVTRANPATFSFPELRFVAQAGGALVGPTRERVRAAFTGASLISMYGQTEATARITCMDPSAAATGSESVGRPIDGTRIEIRDADGRPVPSGCTGEIWVAGEGVMLGYWRDPTATADAVVAGWLRTRDVGHLDAAGYLHVHGRTDDMIKSGGFRIYPAEIEAVIESIPGVREAAVIGRADASLGQVVEAFVVPEGDCGLDPVSVKRECRARLASYKVPTHVRIVPVLPRTSNGKLRRGVLKGGEPTAP